MLAYLSGSRARGASLKPLLGKILVERGVVSDVQLTAALSDQRRRGGRVGDRLVALGFITHRQLMGALAEQRLRWLAAAFGTFIMGLQPVSASANIGFSHDIETGSPVVPPSGFINFCLMHPDACAVTPGAPSVMEGTGERFAQLEMVQNKVNSTFEPRVDPTHTWDYPSTGTADCNKYALEKRRELIALGWPEQSLLLAVVITETNEGHLVLVARLSQGDFVLDNRVKQVVSWTRLPYRWLTLQSPTDTAQWLQVAG